MRIQPIDAHKQGNFFAKSGHLLLQNQGTFLLFSKKDRGGLPLQASCAPDVPKVLEDCRKMFKMKLVFYEIRNDF